VERFDPRPILRRLAEQRVDFVLVGGLAGIVHGSSYPSYDVDIVYARDAQNLERLAVCLLRLEARLRGAPADLPFLLDARTLKAGLNFTFTTPFGSIDLLGEPSYDALRQRAEQVEVDGELTWVVSLDDLIRMKEAAGRPKDKLMASEYRVLADELRKEL
jgi:hypothetical protein